MSEALVKFEGIVAVNTGNERFETMLKFLRKVASMFFARLKKIQRRAKAAHRRTLKLTKGRDTTLPPIG